MTHPNMRRDSDFCISASLPVFRPTGRALNLFAEERDKTRTECVQANPEHWSHGFVKPCYPAD